MSSRIGRRYAQATYPVSKAVSESQAFARNFADGPAGPQGVLVAPGAPVDWATVESTGAAGTNVPITPQVTGLILVTAVLVATNGAGSVQSLSVQVGVGGVTETTPASVVAMGAAGTAASEAAVAFQALVGPLALGVAHNITIVVLASAGGDITLAAEDSTVSVQEVAAASG
jgi:hypothetical protein